jgi:hypothetical protein
LKRSAHQADEPGDLSKRRCEQKHQSRIAIRPVPAHCPEEAFVATQQLTKSERDRRERVRVDTIRDSEKIFQRKTNGLHKTHPTYVDELKKHQDRMAAVNRQYG